MSRVLIACECSGVVRDAFRALGHEAWSCDLSPDEHGSKFHFHSDIRKFGTGLCDWDLMIAHPPCTYLSSSGLHWNGRIDGRADKTEEALEFVRWLMSASIPRICIENPVGRIGTAIRKPHQIIQPYQFGEDASKRTALWLKGLPPLRPTAFVEPRMVGDKPRWANQTDSGQNRLAPSEHRSADRARTYPGIAAAMADQWGRL